MQKLLPSGCYEREQLPHLAGFAIEKAFLQYRRKGEDETAG